MKKIIITTLSSIALVLSAQGALTIDISGSSGSSLVNYTASGSITITEAVVLNSSSTGAAPIGGTWNTGFDNNLGDMFQFGNSSQLNLALSTHISFQNNTVEFGKIEAFDLGTTDTAGGDDFQIDMLGSISYPALTIGDVVSWSGSGNFSLTSGSYGTFFESGSYSASLNGGSFDVNIAPVPEPSSIALLGLGGLATLLRRRR